MPSFSRLVVGAVLLKQVIGCTVDEQKFDGTDIDSAVHGLCGNHGMVQNGKHCELEDRRRPPLAEEKEEKEEEFPPSDELKAACTALCGEVNGCVGWFVHANSHCHVLSSITKATIRDDSYSRSCLGSETGSDDSVAPTPTGPTCLPPGYIAEEKWDHTTVINPEDLDQSVQNAILALGFDGSGPAHWELPLDQATTPAEAATKCQEACQAVTACKGWDLKFEDGSDEEKNHHNCHLNSDITSVAAEEKVDHIRSCTVTNGGEGEPPIVTQDIVETDFTFTHDFEGGEFDAQALTRAFDASLVGGQSLRTSSTLVIDDGEGRRRIEQTETFTISTSNPDHATDDLDKLFSLIPNAEFVDQLGRSLQSSCTNEDCTVAAKFVGMRSLADDRDAIIGSSDAGQQGNDPQNPGDGSGASLSPGIIAAIAAGGAVCFSILLYFLMCRKDEKDKHPSDDAEMPPWAGRSNANVNEAEAGISNSINTPAGDPEDPSPRRQSRGQSADFDETHHGVAGPHRTLDDGHVNSPDGVGGDRFASAAKFLKTRNLSSGRNKATTVGTVDVESLYGSPKGDQQVEPMRRLPEVAEEPEGAESDIESVGGAYKSMWDAISPESKSNILANASSPKPVEVAVVNRNPVEVEVTLGTTTRPGEPSVCGEAGNGQSQAQQRNAQVHSPNATKGGHTAGPHVSTFGEQREGEPTHRASANSNQWSL